MCDNTGYTGINVVGGGGEAPCTFYFHFEEIKFKQQQNTVEHRTFINKMNTNTPCYMPNIKLQIT